MLQANVGNALLNGRYDARDEGRDRLESELEHAFPFSLTTADLDAAAAFVAASAVTASWGSSALSRIAAESSFIGVVKDVEPAVQRTVATEVARAFNDERDRILIDLGDMGGIGGLDTGRTDTRAAGMYKVWSAVLDGVTCQRCFAADGQVIELHQSFKSGEAPPLHPNCRCIVEHVIVPKPERLDDIDIDYGLFKEELRDVIREGRAESNRHALSFVADSLGPGRSRSPKALTNRLANEDYATRR